MESGKDKPAPFTSLRGQLRPFDVVVIILGLALAVGTTILAREGAGNGLVARIESTDGIREYVLDHDEDIIVSGPIGDTVVHIGNGYAEFSDSPCRDKICVHAGPQSSPGAWTACMPNRVFLSVHGDNSVNDGPDAVSR